MAIRELVHDYITGDTAYAEFAGLSTDTKPVDQIVTGSIFVEVNTGKVYFFNEEGDAGSEWVEQFSFQG